MLTIRETNGALDQLGSAAFIPRTRRHRVASPVPLGRPGRDAASVRPVATRFESSSWSAASPAVVSEPGVGRADARALEPEIVLPTQLDDLGKTCRNPVHRLMLAVLEDAVAVYQSACVSQRLRSRPLFRETADWFASDDTSWPFSFVTICQLFGIEPDYLRDGPQPLAGASRGSTARWASRLLRFQTGLGPPPSCEQPQGAPPPPMRE